MPLLRANIADESNLEVELWQLFLRLFKVAEDRLPGNALQTCLDYLQSALAIESLSASLFDDSRGALVLEASSGAQNVDLRHPFVEPQDLNGYLTGRAFLHGAPFVTNDVAAEPLSNDSVTAWWATHLKSGVPRHAAIVPFAPSLEIPGVFRALNRLSPQGALLETGFSASDVKTLTNVAHVTGLCLSRVRRKEQSASVLRFLQESGTDPGITDLFTRAAEAARAIAQSTTALVYASSSISARHAALRAAAGHRSPQAPKSIDLSTRTSHFGSDDFAVIHRKDRKSHFVRFLRSTQIEQMTLFKWRGRSHRGVLAVGHKLHRDIGPYTRSCLKDLSEALVQVLDSHGANARRASIEQDLSAIGHDLNEPLKAISKHLGRLQDLLATEPVSDGYRQLIKGIRAEIDIAERWASTLLEFRPSLLGQHTLDPSPTELSKIVLSCARRFEITAAERNVKIRVRPSVDSLPKILANERLLELALNNIIQNAVKYSDNGTTVEIQGSPNPSFVSVTVVNVGPGIPSEFLEQIFDEFARVPARRRSGQKVEGTGLGLWLARRIVEAHGGEISAESEPVHPALPESGHYQQARTRFRIGFPLKREGEQ